MKKTYVIKKLNFLSELIRLYKIDEKYSNTFKTLLVLASIADNGGY